MNIDGAQKILEDFAEKLLHEKNLPEINDADVWAQLKADLVDRLEDRLNVAILSHMPSEKVSEFEKLLDDGTPEVLQRFVQENVPDLQNVLAAELMAFRKTYLGLSDGDRAA